ncbi:MAG: four helix bundle protein [Bacteroidales bacterium]|nr:four helix bundle protein [Bacteroidales bacterium]
MEKRNQFVKQVEDLSVYKLAFSSAMEIFHLTKNFPNEEKYSLTDQIRRSSRSVCSNLAEGWYKRRYLAAFTNKLTDCVQETAETQTWLKFSKACGYLDEANFEGVQKTVSKIKGSTLISLTNGKEKTN